MEEHTAPKPALTARVRSQRFRAGAVIVVAVVIGLILWLALRDNGSSSPTRPNATATSVANLRALAATVGHPIFWVGPRPGYTYELVRLPNGTINIRYLPVGEDVGTSKPFLSVATYPFRNAYAALKGIKSKDAVFVKIPKGGLAEYTKKYPQSVHAAYPDVDYQVEVYDPAPGTAKALLVAGQLAAFGPLKPKPHAAATAPKPTAASPADLRSLAASLGHSIYWIGTKPGHTYELTRTAGGNVTIRYLPPGVEVGNPKPYLSIGTYPFKNAFAATKALTNNGNIGQVKAPGGAVAVYDKGYPQSIHLAYPGSDLQIEVYDPSTAKARAIVTSGQLRTIG